MENVLCPSCRRPLAPAGEVDCEGRRLIVYQCENCIRPWTIAGETFQAALTFALDESGRPLDPESGQPLPFPLDPQSN